MDEKKNAPLPVGDDAEPHPDYLGLTRGQVRKAQAKAKLRAEEARVAAALKRVEDEETKRLIEEEGLVADGVLGQMVEIVLDMPAVAYGKNDTDAWIQINGKRYYRGKKYTVRLSLANDLLYIADRMKLNESARIGEDRGRPASPCGLLDDGAVVR